MDNSRPGGVARGRLDVVDLTGLAAALTDLVLPGDCAGCGAPDPPWCPACAADVGPPRRVVLPGGPEVLAVGRYAGSLRAAVLRYKERGRRDLAGPLAALLAAGLPARRPLWLVPAPSRPTAARVRGGDHVLRLCRAVAARDTQVRVAPALSLARRARDSVGLDARQRAANLHGRLRVRPHLLPPAGVHVLLVDDIVTTGATVRACRAALAAAGVSVGAALVLCDAS